MAKTDYPSVDAYIAAQPDASRDTLQAVRAAIRKAIPDASEVISYQIPAYRLPGGLAIFFAGWKKHFSVYPVTPGVEAAFGKELAGHIVSKGTIRFPLGQPVPVELIEGIARVRAEETNALKATKTRAKGR